MPKKKEESQNLSLPYDLPVELETRAHGQVVARCPLIPGCQAQGRNPKEALERLKTAVDHYFATASPAFFGKLEEFPGIPLFYGFAQFRGHFYAATNRDLVLKSGNGAPGSWKKIPVTKAHSKFFNPVPGEGEEEGEGDYATQIYCLSPYAPPGKETYLYAGTNLNGSIYRTKDGEEWTEAFATGEDRVHSLCAFGGWLYAGTSSEGKVYAYDGVQWNTVGSLSEVAVTCLGVFQGRLYAGTYPGGFIYSTPDGLNWEEVAATGQSFVQCLKEFKGALYAGTSSAKGVTLYRTENGREWTPVYESAREMNIYCLEVFENALYAGTGNSGRLLKSLDGREWKTAWAGDEEGIRAFGLFGDYLYAGTENKGAILRSTFDVARVPVLNQLRVEKIDSSSFVVAWETDIAATSEVHYHVRGEAEESGKVLLDKTHSTRHRLRLTGLKAETHYLLRVISAHRSSSQAVSDDFEVITRAVEPPGIICESHPQPNKWEKNADVEILLNYPAPLAGFYYVLDDSPDTLPAPPEAVYTEEKRLVFPEVGQGVRYFHAAGVDEGGNAGVRASHYRLLIDTEALPPGRISSSTHPDPEKWISNPQASVEWEAPGDFSGIKGYFVKVDHDPDTIPGPALGDFVSGTSFTTGSLEDGVWYVHVASQDKAGNDGHEAAHYALRVDTRALAPVLSSPSHPHEGQWYSNAKVEVVFTPSNDLSGVEGYCYEVNRDPQALPNPEKALWTTRSKIVLEGLEDGVWYVHARAKDKAGNLSPQASHLRVSIDTAAAPPVLSCPSHAEENRWYPERKVSLLWTDPFDHSGVEGYFYSIDRRPDTVPDGKTGLYTTQRSLSFELSEDGLWYFHITSKDKAGNVYGKAVHYALRVDTQAGKPLVVSPTHPDENLWFSNPKAVFKFVAPNELSGIAGYYYHFSEDPKAAADPKTSTFTSGSEITLDVPRDGIHHLSVLCQDAAGNVSKEPASYQVKLDTSVLPVEITSPSHPSPQKWYGARRVELAWKDPSDLSGIEGYYFVYNREEKWAPDLKVMTWTSARGTVLTAPGDGVWFFHLCAKDRAGNLGPCSSFKIQLDDAAFPPVVKSSTHPLNQWTGNPAPAFQWEAPAELSGVEGYYVLLDKSSHSVPTPASGQWTVKTAHSAGPLGDGKWYFHVATKDLVGNLSKEAAHYPVLVDTTPPKSRMKPLPEVLDRTQLSLEWDAADDLSGVASFDVQVKVGNGTWTEWLPGTSERSATFLGQDGNRYSFRCRARDMAGNVENYPEAAMVSVAVDISPPQPVTQLRVIPRPQGDIELKWQPVEDKVSGTDYYRVYRWTEGGKKKRISTDGQVAETSYLDKGANLQDDTVYYYCVQAVDKMGNEQHEGNQTAACVSDHAAGTPVVNSPTHSRDEWSSNPAPLMTWAPPADATGVEGYYYVLDQSPNTKPRQDNGVFTEELKVQIPDLSSGVWYFHLSAKDRAGNFSQEPAHYALKLDVDRPSPPQLTSPTHGDSGCWYSSGKIQMELAASPKLSGIESFYYAFDREEGTVPTPAGGQRLDDKETTVKAEGPGVWYFHAVVKDRAGNLSEVAHFPVRVAGSEAPPPVVSSPTHPREEEPTAQHDPLFIWEERHEGNFKIKGYVYKLSLEPREELSGQDAFTTERSAQFKDVGEGAWYFHVAAVGKNGTPSSLVSRRKAVIRRVGKLTGVFLQKDGSTPLAGAKVELARGESVLASSTTDSKGGFHFSGVPEGKAEIVLHGPHFPELRLKDIPVSAADGASSLVFTEDVGLFPSPPGPGPTRFYYFLKEDCNVTVEIFDATGNLVEKIEEKKQGGAYNVTLWDATGKPEGEYLYKLSAKSATKNTVSRFAVKKFKIQKNAPEQVPEPVTSN